MTSTVAQCRKDREGVINSRTEKHEASEQFGWLIADCSLMRSTTMRYRHLLWKTALLLSILPTVIHAQVTQADYERAASLRNRFQRLAENNGELPTSIGNPRRIL